MENLKNKKILIFAPELENKEYRGIAFYTKSLIKALSNSGAELWLATSFNPDDFKINKFNERSKYYIYNNEILQNFYKGNYDTKNEIKFFRKNLFLRFLYGYLKKNKLLFNFLFIINIFLKSNKYNKKNTVKIKLNHKDDNPYLKFEKLSFMQNISGFLAAPDISKNLKYKSFLPLKNKIQFDLDYFDCYLTSEPLNLISYNKTPIFQTIHDLIPFEFNTNILNIKSFYRKTKYAAETRRIFVSEATKDKFNYLINNKLINEETSNKESVIIQPPSLDFEQIKFLDIYKNILNSISKENDLNIINNKKNSILQPFNYFLFNASIDIRKNVLLLIESFINSEAQKKGIFLVICGQFKNDEYSAKIRGMIKNNPAIINTGYVNNSKKSALYLNALSLLSPSIIEGFGIPVLDACCLGLECIASDCNSHKEIQNLFDFRNHLTLYPPTSVLQWSKIFYDGKYFRKSNIDNIIENRFLRYKKYQKLIEENFRFKLEKFINNN